MDGIPPILIIIALVVGIAVVRGLIRMGIGAGIDAARKQVDKRAGKYDPSEPQNLGDRFKR